MSRLGDYMILAVVAGYSRRGRRSCRQGIACEFKRSMWEARPRAEWHD